MSFFPRFVDSEFTPMFRLMDDYANHVLSNSGRRGGFGPSGLSSSIRSFQPKFDVKENNDSYELHGELPGVEQKNIEIEFTDPQTLRISGRTEFQREEGERPSGLIEGGQEQAKITAGEHSYHKPTVEDESAQAAGANTDKSKTAEVAKQESAPESHYWLSERSVGEFARSFAFPSRVDQENVKASLKNGILSIIVPKAQAPTSKRINIE